MSDNLNDIFTNTQDSPATPASDDSITIIVQNSANSAKKKCVVYPESTLKEVAECCKSLGLGNSPQPVFEFKGADYSSPTLTMTDLGVSDGDTLYINPNGKVA